MFKAIPVDIRTSPKHGGFVLLDRFSFEGSALVVRLRAAGTDNQVELCFKEVIGLTLKDDAFGSDGGQLTHEDVGSQSAAREGTGFFFTSDRSPTMQALRKSVLEPFTEVYENHQHYILTLREHELSIVADRSYLIRCDFESAALKEEDTTHAN